MNKILLVANLGYSVSWTDAETNAEVLGGHLASIGSAAENLLLTGMLQGNSAWIGYYQVDKLAEPAGDWTWIDGATPGYTNWNSGEPSNSGNAEDWAEIYGGAGGKWNDLTNGPNLSMYAGDVFGQSLNLTGAPGAYSVVVEGSQDATLIGGSGNDTFSGGGGNDSLDGGAGSNWVDYSHDSAGVTVNLATGLATDGAGGHDTLANFQHVTGSNYGDHITGDANNNDLVGLNGNDTFVASAGNDTIDGGDGADLYDLSGEAGPDTVYDYGSSGTVYKSDGTDQIYNVEHVVGSAFNDYGQLENGGLWMAGGDGADTIYAYYSGNYTLEGDAGNDYLYVYDATSGHNSLSGGDGDDTLYDYYSSAATLDAGAGNDSVFTYSAHDLVLGGDGNDTIFDEYGTSTLVGGAGLDVIDLTGQSGSVTVYDYGTSGQVYMPGATDQIANVEGFNAGSSADTFYLYYGGESADGGGGGDSISAYYGGGDTLAGGDGADSIYAYDYYSAQPGDSVSGGAGDDTITVYEYGGATVSGGSGDDNMSMIWGSGELDYSADPSGVTVDLGADTATDGWGGHDTISGFESVIGSDFGDTLTANGADGLLSGGAGDDSLTAAGGNETLVGGAGNDTLVGGAGFYNIADYSNDPGGVTVDLSAGTATDGFGGHDSLVGINAVIGSDHNDTIVGTGSESVSGGAGDDSISNIDTIYYASDPAGVYVNLATGQAVDGYGGHDTLANISHIVATSFTDTLIGGDEDNTFAVSQGNDSIDGGGGVNTLDASAFGEAVSVDLSAGTLQDGDGDNQTLANIQNVIGTAYNDTLTGDDGDNSLQGGDGSDRFMASGGNDTLDGGAGFNTGDLSGASTGIYADLNDGDVHDQIGDFQSWSNIQAVQGSAYDDTLLGDDNDNLLVGGDGSDDIHGAGGNDTLMGGAGDDTLDGGDGTNTADYSGDPGGVTVNLSAGTATDGWGGQDQVSNIQHVLGSVDDDSLTGDDNGDTLEGNGGNDTLIGGAGADSLSSGSGASSIVGGEGDDSVQSNGVDTIVEGSGNDSISAYGAYGTGVSITLGDGHDSIYGNSLNLIAGDGGDYVSTSGNNTLQTGSGDDTVYASSGTDTILVGDGNNYVQTNSDGSDSIVGGAGGDTLVSYYNNGSQTLDGGAGDDSLYSLGYYNNDSIQGGDGADTLSDTHYYGGTETLDGGAGDDSIYDYSYYGAASLQGGDGNDTLVNYELYTAGVSTLDGGAGNDLFLNISANAGSKVLTGGDGSDTYQLSGQIGAAVDTVTDFATGAGGDVLDVQNLLSSMSGLAPGANPFADGHMILVQNGADVLLQVDQDGQSGSSYGLTTVLVLQNTNLDSFTHDNFLQGFQPNGSTGIDVTLGDSGETYAGGLLDDTVHGGAGADSISGFSGDDSLEGAGGNDTLDGGLGNDTLEGASGSGNDSLIGGAGDDSLVAGVGGGDDTLLGGAGNDTLDASGSVGNNSLDGGAGDDSIVGSAQADTIYGNQGHDTVAAGDGADLIFIGDDANVDGGAGADTLIAGGVAETDLLTGGELVNGLGGSAGFGENAIPPNDDSSYFLGNLDSVFGAQGLNFFGHTVHNLYVNNNGYIYFGEGGAVYGLNLDLIDYNSPRAPSPGGTSTGSDAVWYDFDAANHVVTITWDDVRYYYSGGSYEAFQIQLVGDGSGSGNFDIALHYETVQFGGTVGRLVPPPKVEEEP